MVRTLLEIDAAAYTAYTAYLREQLRQAGQWFRSVGIRHQDTGELQEGKELINV